MVSFPCQHLACIVVNHLWIENCYAKWRLERESRVEYVSFPPDLIKIVGQSPVPPVETWLELAKKDTDGMRINQKAREPSRAGGTAKDHTKTLSSLSLSIAKSSSATEIPGSTATLHLQTPVFEQQKPDQPPTDEQSTVPVSLILLDSVENDIPSASGNTVAGNTDNTSSRMRKIDEAGEDEDVLISTSRRLVPSQQLISHNQVTDTAEDENTTRETTQSLETKKKKRKTPADQAADTVESTIGPKKRRTSKDIHKSTDELRKSTPVPEDEITPQKRNSTRLSRSDCASVASSPFKNDKIKVMFTGRVVDDKTRKVCIVTNRDTERCANGR